jgi:Rho GTPase-activating protein 39
MNPGRRSMNPAALRGNEFSSNGALDAELGAHFEKKRRGSLGTGCVLPHANVCTRRTNVDDVFAACRTYPVLPDDLQSDIMQFSESEFVRQYFSTHRTGFIFRRKVPVQQMMTWQKVRALWFLNVYED